MKSRGFTIVELLIVIVVIGILSAITIVAFNGIQQRGRDSVRSSDVKSLQKAIELYKADNNQYPLHAGGTDGTGYNISDLASILVPTYIAKIPPDPKTGQYQYVRGPAANAGYGIRISFEGKPMCKVGVNTASTGWWGVADC
ncbi:MAG: prepilin-type N-terminal cleavage/methylation domain-containing protein [Chloroflexi bacterium]|nr:MAG: prepilin-type N-terminal cleavage/methylation domain-containing protein [Chloroflexota bacterium]